MKRKTKKMRNIAEFKKKKKEWDKVKIADSDFAKRSMKQDLWLQGRHDEKFPGFDQSNRIRGGLKKGGRAKHNIGGRSGYNSGGAVLKGKKVGCQIK